MFTIKRGICTNKRDNSNFIFARIIPPSGLIHFSEILIFCNTPNFLNSNVTRGHTFQIKSSYSGALGAPVDLEFLMKIENLWPTVCICLWWSCIFLSFQIERIQNARLEKNYMTNKQLSDKQNQRPTEERILWHGIDVNTVDTINNYGFSKIYLRNNCYRK